METIHAIIIDDEKHARDALTSLLELYCMEVKVVASAAEIKDGKQVIEKYSPDLVFLDIALGDDNGFHLLELLDVINFQLIFTTAFSEFALKAFRVNAIDYLLKPIEPNELVAAIKKVKKETNTGKLQNQLNHLTQSLNSQSFSQIAISSLDGIIFVEFEKIIHIEGSGNYSVFYLEDGEKIVTSKNLGHYESLLKEDNFFRCHRSYMVNLDFIKKILIKEGNMIELKDGSKVPLTRERKEELMLILSGKFRA